jgi:hypothetical protein
MAKKRGRPQGFSPISDRPTIKKNKNWSMPVKYWEWLESQPNQAKVLRQAIALLIQQENK